MAEIMVSSLLLGKPCRCFEGNPLNADMAHSSQAVYEYLVSIYPG